MNLLRVVIREFNFTCNLTIMNRPNFSAYNYVYRQNRKSRLKIWVLILLAAFAGFLFLPWTQNIRATGTVTALKQEQRPQQINTIIGGRIEKWYIKEGDYVQKGDTLVQLSEIKDDYLDPKLLQRTAAQIAAKQASLSSYEKKISAASSQIGALRTLLQAKLSQLDKKYRQAEVKLQSDSMEVVAATNEWNIALLQYDRQRKLHDSGLVSLSQLESRNQNYQTALAKKISAENKYLASQQELDIIQIEMAAVQQDYSEKILKTIEEKTYFLSRSHQW